MIDTTSLLAAATFTDTNGFWFNGVVRESTNLRDWIGSTLQYFLLRQARIGGKEALKPLVPTNANGTIKTTAVTWAFTFTEEHVIPESFDIIYTPLADRKPFCAVMLWRQQDDLGIPVMRTTEVRYTGTAPDGPFEQHDLSGFCSSENHAVKVGAYILSKRNHVTHRLQLGVKPDAFNPTLAAGDLVRVRLERNPSTGASSLHDYLYEVDRIGKSLAGEVRLDLTHFPVDANKASVVAQEVNAAVGGGLVIGTGASAITCDINSFNDTSVPAESFTTGSFPDYGSSFGGFGASGLGDPGVSNPSDSVGGNEPGAGPGITGTPEVGQTLSYDPGCPGAYTEWRLVNNTTGAYEVVGSGVAVDYIATSAATAANVTVTAVGKCPDPSSPDGYGPEITSSPLTIQNPCTAPEGQGFTGTISPTGTTTISWSGGALLYRNTSYFAGYEACEGTFVYGSTEQDPGGVFDSPGGTTITGGIIGLRFESEVGGANSWQPASLIGSCGGYGNGLRLAVVRANGTSEGIIGVSSQGQAHDYYSVYRTGLTFSSTAPDAVDATNYFGGCN